MNLKQIVGKPKEQVLEHFGDNYISEFGGDLWVYVTNKTWFRRETALLIEFDHEGIVSSAEKVKI